MEVEPPRGCLPTVEGIPTQILETIIKTVRIIENSRPIAIRIHNNLPVINVDPKDESIAMVFGQDIQLDPQHSFKDLLIKPFTGIIVHTADASRISFGAVPTDIVHDLADGDSFETVLSADRLLAILKSCSAIPDIKMRFTDDGAFISGNFKNKSESHMAREIHNDDPDLYKIHMYSQDEMNIDTGFRIRPSEFSSQLSRANGDVITMNVHTYMCQQLEVGMSAVTFKVLVDQSTSEESKSAIYGEYPVDGDSIVDTVQASDNMFQQPNADDGDDGDSDQRCSEDGYYVTHIIDTDSLKQLEHEYTTKKIKGKMAVGALATKEPKSPTDMYTLADDIRLLSKTIAETLKPLDKNCDAITVCKINEKFINICGLIGNTGGFFGHMTTHVLLEN